VATGVGCGWHAIGHTTVFHALPPSVCASEWRLPTESAPWKTPKRSRSVARRVSEGSAASSEPDAVLRGGLTNGLSESAIRFLESALTDAQRQELAREVGMTVKRRRGRSLDTPARELWQGTVAGSSARAAWGTDVEADG